MPPKKPEPSSITVGDMTNSVIQQNSENAVAEIRVLQQSSNSNAVDILKQIKELLPSLNLPADQLEGINHDVKMIESEVSTKEPKAGIVSLCFQSIQKKLIEAGSTAIAGQVISAAQPVIDSINLFLRSM